MTEDTGTLIQKQTNKKTTVIQNSWLLPHPNMLLFSPLEPGQQQQECARLSPNIMSSSIAPNEQSRGTAHLFNIVSTPIQHGLL